MDKCVHKYQKARIEPGTAVGALGAQSIGEPGTQVCFYNLFFLVLFFNFVSRINHLITDDSKNFPFCWCC